MEMYEDRRCLMKSEAKAVREPVIVFSKDKNDRPVYELYEKNGIRVGKLDGGRAWVGKMTKQIGLVAKQDFLAEVLCD